MRVVAVPQALDRRHELAHALAGRGGVETRAEALVFEVVCAAGDADVEATAGDDVGHRRLTGEFDRMPERGDDGARPETDVCGAPGEIGQIDERVRGDGEVHAVVLSGPDCAHSTAVGHLAQLDVLVIQTLVTLTGVEPLHVNEQGKLHIVKPFS